MFFDYFFRFFFVFLSSQQLSCLGGINLVLLFKEMDGLRVKDMDIVQGTRQMENGLGERRENEDLQTRYKRTYTKEATVVVDLAEVHDGKAEDIIKALKAKMDVTSILAVRPKMSKEYEITLEKEEDIEKLDEGLMIKGKLCEIRRLNNKEVVVSFMHLPAYLDDGEILRKLEGWGVTPISQIRRRFYTGTHIEDGTRFLKVRFPKEVAALPYSTRMETEEGSQYFRVIHSRQVRTCRLCMSPEHMMKDCPEFKCFKCEEMGHFARECKVVRCPDCKKGMLECECWIEELNVTQNTESNDVGEHMLKETELENVEETEEDNEGNKEANVDNQEEIENNGQEVAIDEGIWTPLEITQGTLEGMEEKQVKRNEEEKKETTEGMKMDFRRDRREILRRRTIKVIPNIEAAKKKRLVRKEESKEKILWENKFQVLMEEEDEEGE